MQNLTSSAGSIQWDRGGPVSGESSPPGEPANACSECPLLAISGLFGAVPQTSALPPKADIQIMIPGRAPADVRLTPDSGHK